MESEVREIVRNSLKEDIGTGDVTTFATIPPTLNLSGKFLAKSDGTIAGWSVVQCVFECLDPLVGIEIIKADGEWVKAGEKLARIRGPGRAILTGERVALNFLQRMSGIATMTSQFVEKVRGTKAIILDTRKTAPGLRVFDKLAVKIGGGANHRYGLYDMALIKDNHIAAAGGITEAVRKVRGEMGTALKIEVEARTMDEVREAIELNVDRILLDNMTPQEMREAVLLVKNRVPLEASGNVTLENVAEIAATGVQYISVGRLTHSVQSMDISLEIEHD